eukprot:4552749-Pleurochrysis_carterae.AAC.1
MTAAAKVTTAGSTDYLYTLQKPTGYTRSANLSPALRGSARRSCTAASRRPGQVRTRSHGASHTPHLEEIDPSSRPQ